MAETSVSKTIEDKWSLVEPFAEHDVEANRLGLPAKPSKVFQLQLLFHVFRWPLVYEMV